MSDNQESGERRNLTRRGFVGASGVALAGLAADAALPSTLPAAESRPEGQPGSRDMPADQELPPSIAALESVADRARPITNEERAARVERARKLMASSGMDALLLTGGTSLRYFSNIGWGLSERLFALVVEETVRFVYSDGVAQAAPALDLTSGTVVTAGCRGVKDDHELELMQLANHVTLKAYEAAYLALEEGMTQSDFAGLVRLAHQRQGFSGGAGVQVGEFSALPHGSVTPQTIREGTILLIDGGCSVEGYRSDISRTFVLGEPTDKMRAVFEIERRAQDAALAAARPGVECQAVDAAARQVIEEAGYGPGYTYFTHRVGHGIGMDGHEWPYLVKGNTLPLAPGMTFSDEPGIYIPAEFGVRLEDDMFITADGAELFTPQSPSLEDPFGSG